MRSYLFGFSRACSIWNAVGIRVLQLDCLRLQTSPALPIIRCFSTRSRKVKQQQPPPPPPPPRSVMEKESDAFYVVRKGDIIGVYKDFSDCQAQVGSSVCDPSVSVYKGYSLRKETEEYLASRGLRNALFTINAADVKEDLFGNTVPCPFQQPDGLAFLVDQRDEEAASLKRTQEIVAAGSTSSTVEPSSKHPKLAYSLDKSYTSCILEFDGASKGNPGKSGAGAILKSEDGTVIAQLREGLGSATNNVAEYRALLLGLKYALKKGFKKIRVQGDSKLVCNQVQNLWRARNDNMADLCKKAKELKEMFISFQIQHVKREFNGDADAQANLAVELPTGEIQETVM